MTARLFPPCPLRARNRVVVFFSKMLAAASLCFALSIAALADDESPTPFVDRHGAHGTAATDSVQAPPVPVPAAAGGGPPVEDLRGDRRTKTIGYIEWKPRADVAGWKIEWGTSPTGPFFSVSDEPIQGRELLMRGMPASEMVFVRMKSVRQDGAEGVYCEPIAIAPLTD